MKLWLNNSPEPMPLGAVLSAVAVHAARKAWLRIRFASPRRVSFLRSMNWISLAILCSALTGCDHPSSKEARIEQVRREVAQGGGEAKIFDESRVLFARCSTQDWSFPFIALENRSFAGLAGITNLGDVFYYYPDHFEIRIHNSHRDTYFIALLNPDRPDPIGFERIAGNVGFMKLGAAANQH